MSVNTRYFPFAGRVLIGGVFLMSGLTKIGTYAALSSTIAAAGLSLPTVGAAIAILVEVGCGILLLLGLKARTAAVVLVLWCVATAVFFHSNFGDQNTLIHFLKNLMMAGGLLQIAHFGPGALGLDNRKASRNTSQQGALA